MKKLTAVTLLLLILFSLCSCTTKEQVSLTLFAPISSEPKSLDPQTARGNAEEVIVNNCFEGLLRVTENGTTDFGTAESYTVSPDGLTYTFTLNPDAVYHLTAEHKRILGDSYKDTFDTSVKAQDFVFAFQRALSPVTKSPYAEKLLCVKNAEAVLSGSAAASELGIRAQSDYTLIIELKYKDPSFLYTLTSPVAMPCNEVFFNATGGKYGLDLDYILCNGPLYVTTWSHGSSVGIKKNPEYFGKAKVNASLVTLVINNDESSVAQRVTDNTYDCAFVDAKTMSGFSSSLVNIDEYNNIVWGLLFNCADPYLSDMNIRKALYLSFDRSLIEAPSYVSGVASYVLPGDSLLGNTLYSSVAPACVLPAYDEAAVKAYWEAGRAALRVETVNVSVSCSADFRGSLEKQLQNWQELFGTTISVKIIERTEEEIKALRGSSSFSLAFVPAEAESLFAEKQIAVFCREYANFESGTLNSLLNSLGSAYDIATQANIISQAENVFISECAFIPVFSGCTYFVTNKKTSGVYCFASENALYFCSGARYE